jgi:hypothetical protein
MKYSVGGDHVKTLPKKYKDLDIGKCLCDFDHKRLQPVERQNLEKEWGWKKLITEILTTYHDRLILEEFGRETPSYAVEVLLRNGKKYHVLRSESGKEVRVPASIFNCFPKQKIIARNY